MNAIQLNGSPHYGRRRRSDGLFQRPGSRSRVRRTTRTPADALSTRLDDDDDDDDHVDSTPLQADGPGSAIVPRTVLQSPTTLRQALMPLDFHASRRPRFRFVPATERLSLRLLPTTATSLSVDVPWLPSNPASRRSTLRSPQQRTGTAVPSLQWWQLSPDEALLRLTRSNGPGANSLSTHCRAYTQLKLHFRSTFHYAATHSQTHVRSLAWSTVNCSHSRNFFASHSTCAFHVHTIT